MAVTLGNITFYADDPHALAAFWAAVFGYPEPDIAAYREWALSQGFTEGQVMHRGLAEDPEGRGPRLYFHTADGPKRHRNRLHLDVNIGSPGQPPELLDAEKDRLVALGATVVRLVDQQWGPVRERYYQLRDPEGNEFCLQG
jgi:uncharacterized glyoxalase superfamily protein PhnB